MNTTTSVAPLRTTAPPDRIATLELGGLAFGDHYGPTDQRKTIQLIQQAVGLGVTSFDTSPSFGSGAAELLLSLALGSTVEDVTISTKATMPGDNPFVPTVHADRDGLFRGLENSLRRLGRRFIDMYYLYGQKDREAFVRSLDAAREIREAGLVRRLGLYATSSYFLRVALEHTSVDAVMVPYNIFNRPLDTDFLPYCREHNIPVHACEPLCRGLLTGQLHKNSTFGEGDLRLTDPRFRGDTFRDNIRLVEQLGAFATRQGMTLLALSLGWVLQHPAISAAVCGARSLKQIEQVIKASASRLTLEQILEVDLIVGSNKYQSNW